MNVRRLAACSIVSCLMGSPWPGRSLRPAGRRRTALELTDLEDEPGDEGQDMTTETASPGRRNFSSSSARSPRAALPMASPASATSLHGLHAKGMDRGPRLHERILAPLSSNCA